MNASGSYVLINVHQVVAEDEDAEDAVDFLRNADKDFVEGLFFNAKTSGRAEFTYDDQKYELTRNKNLTYTVRLLEDEDTKYLKDF